MRFFWFPGPGSEAHNDAYVVPRAAIGKNHVFVEVLASLLVPYVAYVVAESLHLSGVLAVVAAALALPVALDDGTPFPYRDVIVFFTFVVIAATLVLQGLTLPALIRRLRVGRDWSLNEERENARNAMSKAAIAAIEALAREQSVAPEVAERISTEYSEKNPAGDAEASVSEEQAGIARRLRHAAVNARAAGADPHLARTRSATTCCTNSRMSSTTRNRTSEALSAARAAPSAFRSTVAAPARHARAVCPGAANSAGWARLHRNCGSNRRAAGPRRRCASAAPAQACAPLRSRRWRLNAVRS